MGCEQEVIIEGINQAHELARSGLAFSTVPFRAILVSRHDQHNRLPGESVRSSRAVLFVECVGEYMSCVEATGVGQPITGMCDMMKQDKSNRYCS